MKKLKILIILFCTLFLCSFDGAYKTTYQPLSDLSFTHKSGANVLIHHNQQTWEVNYTYYNQNNDLNQLVRANIIRSSNLVFQFADVQSLRFNECVPKDHLEIYQIPEDVLNDHTRFEGWQIQNKNAFTIWGLFDPRLGQKILASIMITDHGEKENSLIFSHELSHYWYDRFCWNEHWIWGDELFATQFEKFYLKQENP